MSIAQKILSNTLIQIIGKGFMSILSLVAVMILTNYLSPELYGQYNTVYIYLSIFSIAADLGIYTIAVREMSKNEGEIPSILGNILSIRTILSIVVVALAIVVAFFIPQYQGKFIPLAIAISGIGTVIALINGVIVSIFQTKLETKYSTISLLVGKAVSVACLALIAFVFLPKESIQTSFEKMSWAFYLTIIAGIVSSIAMIIVTLWYTRKFVHLQYKFDVPLWKKLLKESLPYGIALILGTLYLRIDGFMLSLIKGDMEVGIYSVATKILEVINVIPVLFMSTVLPVLTKYLIDSREKIKELLKHSFSFLLALGIPIMIGMYVLSYQMVFILSGGSTEYLTDKSINFWGSDIALKILCFALICTFINNLFIYLLVAVNEQKKLLLINGTAVVLNILLNLLVIPSFGFRGSATITIFCEFLVLCGTWWCASRHVRFIPDIKTVLKILFSGACMAVTLWLIKEPIFQALENKGLFLLIAIGGIVYFGVMFLTRAIDKKHITLLLKKEPVHIPPENEIL